MVDTANGAGAYDLTGYWQPAVLSASGQAWLPPGGTLAVAGALSSPEPGAAIGGRAVRLEQHLGGASWLLLAQTNTGADGSFAFSLSPPSTLTWRVTFGTAYGLVAATSATHVTTVSNPGSLVGTVRFGTTPLGGVSVKADTLLAATTGPTGTYAIANVPPGTYVVEFSKPGYVTQALAGVVVAPGGTATVDATFESALPGALSGIVTCGSALLQGVSVQVGSMLPVQTRADGEYVVAGIVPGTYSVSFSKNGYLSWSIPEVLISAATTSTRDVDMAVDPGALPGTLAGTVTSGGSPLPGVLVQVGSMVPTTTGPDGRYAVSGIVPGTCTASFSKQGFLTQILPGVPIGPGTTTTRDVALLVAPGGGSTGTIAGTVRDGRGQPIPWVMVQVGSMAPLPTDADGRYEVSGISPGVHSVSFTKDAYPTRILAGVVFEAGSTVTTDVVLADAPPVPPPTPALARLRITRAPSASILTYRRRSGFARYALSAVVRTAKGAPVRNRWMYLQTSANGKTGWKSSYKMKTNASGKVAKSVLMRTAGSRYYRWYLPATKTNYLVRTGVQRVNVR